MSKASSERSATGAHAQAHAAHWRAWAAAFRCVSVGFTLRARQTCALPPFLGSTLRGALGHALLAVDPAVAAAVFEGAVSQPARPGYAIEAPARRFAPWAPHDPLHFGLTLFGAAAEAFPAFAEAVLRAAETGLGAERAPFDLVRVEETDTSRVLWSQGDDALRAPAHVSLPEEAAAAGEVGADDTAVGEALTVQLVTPLVLANTAPEALRLDAEALLRGLVRRCAGVLESWGGQAPAFAPWQGPWPSLAGTDVHPAEVQRYSARQGGGMHLTGLVGTVRLAGPGVLDTLPLWRMAERTHLGKLTVAGLGAVRVRVG